ncbi:MAG: hypothetical protein ABIG95_04970 [Candidatus Woesearchaeota archaeon]
MVECMFTPPQRLQIALAHSCRVKSRDIAYYCDQNFGYMPEYATIQRMDSERYSPDALARYYRQSPSVANAVHLWLAHNYQVPDQDMVNPRETQDAYNMVEASFFINPWNQTQLRLAEAVNHQWRVLCGVDISAATSVYNLPADFHLPQIKLTDPNLLLTGLELRMKQLLLEAWESGCIRYREQLDDFFQKVKAPLSEIGGFGIFGKYASLIKQIYDSLSPEYQAIIALRYGVDTPKVPLRDAASQIGDITHQGVKHREMIVTSAFRQLFLLGLVGMQQE